MTTDFDLKMSPQQGQHNHFQTMKTSCVAHLFSAGPYLMSDLKALPSCICDRFFFEHHVGEIKLDR